MGERPFVIVVDAPALTRGGITGTARGALSALATLATEGFVQARPKVWFVVRDTRSNAAVARLPWGRDGEEAAEAVPALQSELDRLGLPEFCREFISN